MDSIFLFKTRMLCTQLAKMQEVFCLAVGDPCARIFSFQYLCISFILVYTVYELIFVTLRCIHDIQICSAVVFISIKLAWSWHHIQGNTVNLICIFLVLLMLWQPCQIVMFSWIHLLILFSAHLSLFIVCLVTLLCMPKLEIFYPNIISWYPISQVATWLLFLCFHLFDHSPRISVCSRLEIIGQGVEGLLLWFMSGSNMRKKQRDRETPFSVYCWEM